jgi:hypothetical protein
LNLLETSFSLPPSFVAAINDAVDTAMAIIVVTADKDLIFRQHYINNSETT